MIRDNDVGVEQSIMYREGAKSVYHGGSQSQFSCTNLKGSVHVHALVRFELIGSK